MNTSNKNEYVKKENKNYILKDWGLKLPWKTNVDFLDVTFNLHNESYHPFRKPNDNHIYIHTQAQLTIHH